MKSFVAVLALLAVASVEGTSRITGGKEAPQNAFPHQVGLFLHIGEQQAFCGGSLIDPQWVLTAGHCVDGVDAATVVLGAHNIRKAQSEEPGRVEIRVPKSNFILHESYNGNTIRNDIALIKLPSPVELTATIQTIALPRLSDEKNKFERRPAIASGWGRDSDAATGITTVLRYIETSVMSLSTCKLKFLLMVQDSNICIAGEEGKSTCNGDSGGPLTTPDTDGKPMVIGLTSFGLASSCEKVHPAVFTSVPYYLRWISSRTGITLRN